MEKENCQSRSILWVFFASLLFGCTKEPENTPLPGECSEAEFEAVTSYLIGPLFEPDHEWTCTQCHSPGIDPTLWSQSTACQTMACYQDNGFVDFDLLADSEIIMRIHQAEPEGSIGTELFNMRQSETVERMKAESDGFLRWINYGASCFEDACSEEAQKYNGVCGFQLDWGKCDPEEGLERYEEEAHEVLERQCASCHSAGGEEVAEFPLAPHFIELDETAGAYVTLNWIIEKSYVDQDEPNQSRLLSRPLEQDESVETSLGLVTGARHGGGDRFLVEDGVLQDPEDFDSLVSWIGLYADCFSP